MLQPNAKKSLDQAELAELVAEFKQRGGVIEKLETGVSGGVKKAVISGVADRRRRRQLSEISC